MKKLFANILFTIIVYLFFLGLGYLISLAFTKTLSNLYSNAMVLSLGFLIGCYSIKLNKNKID